MKVKILLFGELAQIAATSELQENNITSSNALNEHLHQRFPELKRKKYVIAVNKQIVQQDIKLNDGDEIALLPPFAGG